MGVQKWWKISRRLPPYDLTNIGFILQKTNIIHNSPININPIDKHEKYSNSKTPYYYYTPTIKLIQITKSPHRASSSYYTILLKKKQKITNFHPSYLVPRHPSPQVHPCPYSPPPPWQVFPRGSSSSPPLGSHIWSKKSLFSFPGPSHPCSPIECKGW